MNLIILTTVLVLAYMTLIFFLAMAVQDNSIVDIFYGTVFLVGGWGGTIVFGNGHPRQLLLMSLITLWGLRLAIHLLLRKKGHGEDFRYKQWRESWGSTFVWRSFLQIFMLQGVVVLIILTPVLLTLKAPGAALGGTDFIGVAIWLVGFFFEAVGDWQLLQFKKDGQNKGRIMRSGIWQYTRHPNYFGEATLWWGIFLIGLGAGNGIYGLISPLLIGFLLLKVSGIPMLEVKYEGNPEFEAYRQRTNAFFPWFPKTEH